MKSVKVFNSLLIIFSCCVPRLISVSVDSVYHDRSFDGTTTTDPRRNKTSPSMICMDVGTQPNLDMEQVTGMWYGSEIIVHTQAVPGIYRYDSCVSIHLEDVTEQFRGHAFSQKNEYNHLRQTSALLDSQAGEQEQQPHRSYQQQPQQQHQSDHYYGTTKYLRLLWVENENDLEYLFKYQDIRPGVWTNVNEQSGAIAVRNQYTQFTGTVQVFKAVKNHLVLTFCGNDVRSSIYTIVLGRNIGVLSEEDILSIRNLLYRKGLSTDTIRQVCVSGAVRAVSFWSLLFFTALCILKFN